MRNLVRWKSVRFVSVIFQSLIFIETSTVFATELENKPLFDDKCKETILHYVEQNHHPLTDNEEDNIVLNVAYNTPWKSNQFHNGILRDEFDFYQTQYNLKNYEIRTIEADQKRLNNSIRELSNNLTHYQQKNGTTNNYKDELQRIIERRSELIANLEETKKTFHEHQKNIRSLENKLSFLSSENEFLIYASAIFHEKSSRIEPYFHWLKFISPSSAKSKNCAEKFLSKRLSDSAHFFSENSIYDEDLLAERIFSDLALEAHAPQSRQKTPQRSTASNKGQVE